jgi:hypothetical protein
MISISVSQKVTQTLYSTSIDFNFQDDGSRSTTKKRFVPILCGLLALSLGQFLATILMLTGVNKKRHLLYIPYFVWSVSSYQQSFIQTKIVFLLFCDVLNKIRRNF